MKRLLPNRPLPLPNPRRRFAAVPDVPAEGESDSATAEPKEGDVEADRRPGGCNRDARVNASVPLEPFMLLLLAGPVGILGLRRFRKPPF